MGAQLYPCTPVSGPRGRRRAGEAPGETPRLAHMWPGTVTNTLRPLYFEAGLWAYEESWSRPILRILTISIEW